MSCKVIMDVRLKGNEFEISKNGKSASIICEFVGDYKGKDTVDITVLVTSQTSRGYDIKRYVQKLNETLLPATIVRVTGKLTKLEYQNRENGLEVEEFRLLAYQLEESVEQEPFFSVAFLEGYVSVPEGKTMFNGKKGVSMKASFSIAAKPDPNYDREGYLRFLVKAFGNNANFLDVLKVKDGSYVRVVGRLKAASLPGLLLMTLHDVNYATTQKKEN